MKKKFQSKDENKQQTQPTCLPLSGKHVEISLQDVLIGKLEKYR